MAVACHVVALEGRAKEWFSPPLPVRYSRAAWIAYIARSLQFKKEAPATATVQSGALGRYLPIK